MRKFLLASVFVAAPLVAANAIQIINAAQTSGSNTVTATADAAFGLTTGNQLSVNIAQPPDTLVLSSSVIPAADLAAPNSLTFAMSNLTSTAPFVGGLQADNMTIAPFTASFVATADASPAAVNTPEPATLGLFASGLFVLSMVRFRRQQ